MLDLWILIFFSSSVIFALIVWSKMELFHNIKYFKFTIAIKKLIFFFINNLK